MIPQGRRVPVDTGQAYTDRADAVPGLPGQARALPERPERVLDLMVRRVDGSLVTIAECLARTYTDAFVVVHDGAIVAQWYATERDVSGAHALMSITKSIVGCATGALVGKGMLDPEALATAYVPELGYGGYAGATVRDLLDMRTGGPGYHEDYDDPDSEIAWLSRAVEAPWPGVPGAPAPLLRDLVATAQTRAGEARSFCYRSLDTEALGWVVERAGGRPVLDALGSVLQPLGLEGPASICIDAAGVPQCSGSLALTARDAARFGLMLLHGGSVGAAQVVPAAFVKDTRIGASDSERALQARVGQVLGSGTGMRTGFYRNQFWVPERGSRTLLCLGIHGQLVYVDSRHDTVVVKLSSWPQPQDPALFTDGLTCAQAIARQLGATDPNARRAAPGSSTSSRRLPPGHSP